MNLRYKHIILVLLVLSAAAPFLIPGGLMIQRALVVHEMMEKLERSELQVVEIHSSKLRWYEEGRECWINDRMFDVKEMHTKGEMVVLKGLYDDEEKEIIARLGTISTPLPRERERSNTIFQLTHLDLEYNLIPTLRDGISINRLWTVYNSHFPTTYSPPIFLPPEMI